MTKKRIVVGARYGLFGWVVQRASAVVLVAYTILLTYCVLRIPELDYETWTGLFASSWMKVTSMLAFAAVSWHAWIGLRDIYMDYVHCLILRLFLQISTVLVLAGYFCWAWIIFERI